MQEPKSRIKKKKKKSHHRERNSSHDTSVHVDLDIGEVTDKITMCSEAAETGSTKNQVGSMKIEDPTYPVESDCSVGLSDSLINGLDSSSQKFSFG